MIRAIPKTLQPSASDYGLPIQDNPKLAQFMQEHDNTHIGKPNRPSSGSGYFSYGRPIREFMPTLEAMTGQSLGWHELNFVHFGPTAEQQRIQRQLFLQLAERWARWWSKNWQTFVKNEADAQLDIIRQSLGQCAKSIPPPPSRLRTEFPSGPKVTVGGGTIDQQPKSFEESPSQGFLDLDSGRQPNPPSELIKNSSGNEPSKELLAWAEREGVDLVTITVKPSGSDKSYYAFKPLDMKVWRIENDRYEHLQQELSKGKKIELPAPWQGLLATVDEKTGKYGDKLTASFLFITKEGTCGAIQLRAPLSGGPYTGGGLRYQFIYEGDAEKLPDMDSHGAIPASPPAAAIKQTTEPRLVEAVSPVAAISGQVLDYENKPVENARVFLRGRGSLSVENGEVDWHSSADYSIEGSVNVGNDNPNLKRWIGNARLDVVRTDADGRFQIARPGKDYTHVIVLAPHLYIWAVPVPAEHSKQELTIRLPQPAAMKVVMDIPGAIQANEERVVNSDRGPRVEPAGKKARIRLHLMTWDMEGWKNVGDFVQTRTVANPGEVVFANLTPGLYDFSRTEGKRGHSTLSAACVFWIAYSCQLMN